MGKIKEVIDEVSDKKTEKKTWKKDELVAVEEKIQQEWDSNPMSSFSQRNKSPLPGEGYLATFPYPYSNGELHLGHGFTAVFFDVMAREARLRGVPVAQSFSYHLTGMPIVAAASRLQREFEAFDNGNSSALTNSDDGKITQYSTMCMMGIPESEIRKFIDPHYWGTYFPEISKKVIRRFGIASDNAKSFTTTDRNRYYDAFAKWHFQKLHKSNKLVFGKRYSLYSRKDAQPCLGHERSEGEDAVPAKFTLIKFRVNLNDKTNEKSDLMKFTSDLDIDGDAKIYLIGLTMRPETLVGLTNIWIDADHSYRVYRFGFINPETSEISTEYWIMQEKNRVNLQYQWINRSELQNVNNPFDSSSPGFKDCGFVKGSTFVNANVEFDDSTYPVWAMDFNKSDIYKEVRNTSKASTKTGSLVKARSCIESHLRINTSKGTGIVGSVPSDSPIDYLGYMYKGALEYGRNNWDDLSDFIDPIIQVTHSNYTGNRVARDLVESKLLYTQENKIPMITDEDMAAIKEFCYVTSIASQSMIGSQEGMSMTDVRNTIEESCKCVANPSLLIYYESDSLAISRTGDELIVALLDQWFIDYSDPEWKKHSLAHVESMEFFDDVAKDGIIYAINWLQQWPCSRTSGLGSRIPLSIVQSLDSSVTDESECPLIDSLSDSTIYMCLYTIYDQMQEFDPSEFTEDVFDYIFLLKHNDNQMMKKFAHLRNSFLTFYPVNLRVSAKDLINNHLAMCIMNHVAVWDQEFMNRYRTFTNSDLQSFGPMSYRINGYITVAKKDKAKRKGEDIAEKMSKSKGNFKTLAQALDTYAADPLRFTFCSANIGTSDAYFDQDLATRTVEKLHKENEFILSYCHQVQELAKSSNLESDTNNEQVNSDHEFDMIRDLMSNELSLLIRLTREAYKKTDIRNVIHHSNHMLLNLRDTYVKIVGYHNTLRPENIKMMAKFFVTFITLMYPIIPHFSENITRNSDYQSMLESVFSTKINSDFSTKINSGFSTKINSDFNTKTSNPSIGSLKYLDNCLKLVESFAPPDNSLELKFRLDFATKVASDISSKYATYLERKMKVESITVYCLAPATVIGDIDKICFRIVDELGFSDKETDQNILMAVIKKEFDDETADKKTQNKIIGEIIRQYRKIEDIYLKYPDIFSEIRRTYSSSNILNQLLNPLLKQTKVDCPINVLEISSESDSSEAGKVRFYQPYITWNTSK